MADQALPEGIVTPLVAFVTETGAPDPEATAALVEHQLAAGVAGVLVNGSTGELGNLSVDERAAELSSVVGLVRGRVPVWAGVGGLGTADTVEAARAAEAGGADALLVLPPLFFDLGDAELAMHFATVAKAVSVPVLAYDVPPRTPRKLPAELVAQLGRDGVLRGVKDSSGDLTAGRKLCVATAGVPGFRTYVGSEVMLDVAVTVGFGGSVPGLANILPAVAVEVDRQARADDLSAAAQAQAAYLELLRILDVPLADGGFPARAIMAIKVATAVVIGLPTPRATMPFAQPDDAFVAGVRAIVEPLARP